MTVSVLIVSFGSTGTALLDAAKQAFAADKFSYIDAIPVHNEDNIDELVLRASLILKGHNAGDGTLLLTDMYGSTPSNVAKKLREQAESTVMIVTGVNLPMLFRVINYAHLPLAALAEKAASGGREGVMICQHCV